MQGLVMCCDSGPFGEALRGNHPMYESFGDTRAAAERDLNENDSGTTTWDRKTFLWTGSRVVAYELEHGFELLGLKCGYGLGCSGIRIERIQSA
jgi:hypothetical protein